MIGVYPRVCGVTDCQSLNSASVIGLSPRVRGHRQTRRKCHDRCGSIPACAGSPLQIAANDALKRVYPRVCGVTLLLGQRLGHVLGLSPRVRGHQCRIVEIAAYRRSIPACAGSPPCLP